MEKVFPRARIRDHTPHTILCQAFPLQSGSMCKTLLTPPREADEKRMNLSKQAPAANSQHFLLSSLTKQTETHETLSPDIKAGKNGRAGECGGQGERKAVRAMTREGRNLMEDVWVPSKT